MFLVEPLNNRAGHNDKIDNSKDLYDCYRCNRYKGGGQACPETLRQIPGMKLGWNGNPWAYGCNGDLIPPIITCLYLLNWLFNSNLLNIMLRVY